jgi:cytochrome c oxidase cbb3-type subunit IV
MIRNVLENITGIQIYPIISLVLFVSVFVGMTWWAMRLHRNFSDYMGNLPLEDDNGDK